jgi:hypothetical protein
MFGGNPILERTDITATDARTLTNVATTVDGLRSPSTVRWTLSTPAVQAMDLDNEIQFRISVRDTKTATWYTNNDDGCVCACDSTCVRVMWSGTVSPTVFAAPHRAADAFRAPVSQTE